MYATSLTSKLAMQEKRDKNIQDDCEKLNNEIIKKYAKDKVRHQHLDKCITKLRSPSERIFPSKLSAHGTQTLPKNQATASLYAHAYNFRMLFGACASKPWVRCAQARHKPAFSGET